LSTQVNREQQEADGPRDANAVAVYSLADIFAALGRSLKFEEMLHHILEVSLRELNADQGSLLLLESEEQPSLKMLASHGLPEDILRRGYVERKGSISEHVLRERCPLVINDLPCSEHFESMEQDAHVPRQISSALCVPLIVRDRAIGTLNLNRARGREAFTSRHLNICVIIASQAAIVIENGRLQRELIEKERLAAVGIAVAHISHCIKNILTGLRGGIGLMDMGFRDDSSQRIQGGLDLVKRSAASISNLVLDLLDYAAEREPLRMTFSMGPVLRDVCETIAHAASGAGVLVEREVDDSIKYDGDRDQIFRAILNLATNAVEACTDCERPVQQPRVLLSAHYVHVDARRVSSGDSALVQRWLSIAVSDNGPGIPADRREKIWELFFSTKGSRGTGIGLATTRRMIEGHRGQIALESVDGAGSTFTIMLPIREN
jgi:signal transduction histidine kinase